MTAVSLVYTTNKIKSTCNILSTHESQSRGSMEKANLAMAADRAPGKPQQEDQQNRNQQRQSTSHQQDGRSLSGWSKGASPILSLLQSQMSVS